MTAACRACAAVRAPGQGRCAACGDPRAVAHPDLLSLTIAHIDCDAFYAAVEKRDDPSLAARPVIVGGGRRGVVATACYLARAYGVRSAMPMFKALAACPHAVVIRPDMAKYAAVSHRVRTMMEALTPLVEPVSIDEAFLDLSGTALLHEAAPAQVLIRLQNAIEETLQITVSVGLSGNKFLAKLASDLDKPRGFCVIAPGEAPGLLAPLPVSRLPGVGPKLQATLIEAGFGRIGDLQHANPRDLERRFGDLGRVLHERAHGRDARHVEPDSVIKSVSSETTFLTDIADPAALLDHLWPLCWRTGERAKAAGVAGRVIVLKLKDSRFRITTRSLTLREPTQLGDVIFRHARTLLEATPPGMIYRLIGVALKDLCAPELADHGDLLDARRARAAAAERAADSARARFGGGAVIRGRDLRLAQDRVGLDDQPFGRYDDTDNDG